MDLTSLIGEHRNELTRTERRVAEAVLRNPQAIAFGTLASVAKFTGTSGTSIIRLAAKLGLTALVIDQRRYAQPNGRGSTP